MRRHHLARGLGIADTLMAAAARVRGAVLFALNLKHCPMTEFRVHRLSA